MKITDIKEILSEKCNFSGIRGCMAAGALTAGIAAFAFIGGINSNDDVASVSAEDKSAEENISISAVPDPEEKKEYAHDREYFTYEEMMLMTMGKESAEETEAMPEETEAQAEESEEQATEVQIEESAEEESEKPEEAEETEPQPEEAEAEEEAEEQPAETEAPAEERAAENSNVVSERNSAANGDEDDSGLSSALDIDIIPVPAAEYEPDLEFSFEDAVLEAQTINEGAKDEETEADNDTVTVVYENSTEEAEPVQNEEQSEEASEEQTADEEEDLAEIPEDITLDDEYVQGSVPQEGAISLFDLPEWLEFDENGLPTKYKEVLTGKACAYTAEPGALMSTGDAVFQGYVAVDPDIIPYGSELYIVAEDGEVYGYAIAGDTGYSVKAGHIIVDLFMNEYDDCIQWGNKPVNVYVLK